MHKHGSTDHTSRLVASGTHATGRLLRRGCSALLWRNWIWKRRNFEVIAKAPPEYARTMSPTRNTTIGDTKLSGSILEREGRVSRFSGQYMEDREYYHHPESTNSSSMDSFENIFLFVLALLLVSFLKVQL
ncbi:uncharacterized protein LOC111388028 [Olea europaea var. sylvestris]|uniref:uncharacterized protein LOC111388028 n=1 Tax=Olea europaea var. sylvestris TaxID=158386 RepID=UPI000C1D5E59|nr:uncharacterized protein LOC111388028 [Olea europaea var. sylvestris]